MTEKELLTITSAQQVITKLLNGAQRLEVGEIKALQTFALTKFGIPNNDKVKPKKESKTDTNNPMGYVPPNIIDSYGKEITGTYDRGRY